MKAGFLGWLVCLMVMHSSVAMADPFEDVYNKFKARQYDEAIAQADEYIAKNASDRELAGSLTFIKALCVNEQGNLALFEQMAKEFAVKYPTSKFVGDMQANLIGMYYKQKKYAEVKRDAVPYLEKYGQKFSKNTERVEWFLVASWVKSGNCDLVEPFVSKLLAERPKHTQRSNLLFLDAEACLKDKQYTKAYDKFYRLANADPDEGICRKSKFYAANSALMLANEMRVNNEPKELVEKQYKHALELFETFQSAFLGDKSMWTQSETRMIQCYRQLGKYDSLDTAVKNALSKPEHQSDKGVLLYEQAYSYFERQQWAHALETYNSLLNWSRLKPSNANFLKGREEPIEYQRALCFLNLGQEPAFEKASIEFQAKYPNSSNCYRVAYAAASVPFKKENWSASIASLQSFLSKNQQAPEELKIQAEYMLVSSMLLANEHDQVRKFVREKVVDTPDYAGRQGLQFLAAMADFKAGRWSEASSSLCKLIEQSPEGEVAANAKLYVGLCKMHEAQQKKNGGDKAQITALQQEGRKNMIEWAKGEKPPVQTDLDALYLQNDFAAIKAAASKYLESGDQADPAKKAQMLNWMGIVAINQDPPDLKGAKNYFDQASEISRLDLNRAGSEAIKASIWNTWIALYNDDEQQAHELTKELKRLPDSPAKLDAIRVFQFIMK